MTKDDLGILIALLFFLIAAIIDRKNFSIGGTIWSKITKLIRRR
jgi:hypothetical protein